MVGEGEFGVVDSYFGHCFAICPGSLYLKQFDWSVVVNIWHGVSSQVTTKDGVSCLRLRVLLV